MKRIILGVHCLLSLYGCHCFWVSGSFHEFVNNDFTFFVDIFLTEEGVKYNLDEGVDCFVNFGGRTREVEASDEGGGECVD